MYSLLVKKLIFTFFPEKEELLMFNDFILLINGKSSELSYCFYDILESGLYNFLKKQLKKGDVFIDIGAHIGYYTILASKNVRWEGKVIAFEPSISNFNRLVKNIKINQCKNVALEHFAILNKHTHVKLFNGMDTFTHSLIRGRNHFPYSFVQSTSLDKYVFNKGIKPEVIKIDVEGSELDVINSSKRVIKVYKPILIVEFHPQVLGPKFSTKLKNSLEFLRRYYKFYLLWDGRIFQIRDPKKYITIIHNKYRMPVYPKLVFFPIDHRMN